LNKGKRRGIVSPMQDIYLDWAATAVPEASVLDQVREISLSCFGNPSSAHSRGKEAAARLETCRTLVAEDLGAEPRQICFTSGGTESDNLILLSLLGRKRSPGSLAVSAFEHPAVWEPARLLAEQGWNLISLPAGPDGIIRPERLRELLREDTELVSIMAVNNETGVRQPLKELAEVIREKEQKTGRKILFHTDAVQALGKESIRIRDWGVDAASFSGHKIGAPRGVGCLYLNRPLSLPFRGGGQEGGLRSGTENLGGIAGLSLALRERTLRMEEHIAAAKAFRERLYRGLKDLGGVFSAPEEALFSEAYSPWLLWAAFPPVPGEVLARVLSDRGVQISTGSACASRHKKTFRVTRGLGIPDGPAFSALRISWGPSTAPELADRFLEILAGEVKILQKVAGSPRRR